MSNTRLTHAAMFLPAIANGLRNLGQPLFYPEFKDYTHSTFLNKPHASEEKWTVAREIAYWGRAISTPTELIVATYLDGYLTVTVENIPFNK
jgi:hypothetical protein